MAITLTELPSNLLCSLSPIIFEFSSNASNQASIRIGTNTYTIEGNNRQFYFNAQEAVQSFLDFDYRDALGDPAATPVNRTDASLFSRFTITFSDGTTPNVTRTYTAFHKPLQLGQNVLRLNSNQLLVMQKTIPVHDNGYQEIAIYNNRNAQQTLGGYTLEPRSFHRIPITGFSDASNLLTTFGIRLFENINPKDGVKIKYFSKFGTWVYLTSLCFPRLTIEPKPQKATVVAPGNPSQIDNNLLYTAPTVNRFLHFGIQYNKDLLDFVLDLATSRAVYIESEYTANTYQLVQIIDFQAPDDLDSYGTISFRALLPYFYN